MRHSVAYPQEHLPYETHRIEFDDFDEFIGVAEETNALPWHLQTDLASIQNSEEFTGTASMSEAIDLARFGWPEGTQLLQDAADQITVKPAMGDALRPEVFFDVAGSEPDVGRYLGNDPENMIDLRLRSTPQGNVVELAVECAQPGRMSRERLMRRGAAVLAAVEAIQANGYSVGVMAVTNSSTKRIPRRELSHLIPIIEPGAYVDADRLAFAMAHPSFFRRLIFATYESLTSPDMRRDLDAYWHGYYGVTQPIRIVPNRDHPLVCVRRTDGIEGDVEAAQQIVHRVEDQIEHLREHGRKTVKVERKRY